MAPTATSRRHFTNRQYILPANDECVETFQWLAQEIEQADGRALVMHVEQFEGLTDQQLIERFCEVRNEDYQEIDVQAAELEARLGEIQPEDRPQIQDALAKLHKQYMAIAYIDYFDCPGGTRVAERLAKIRLALSADATPSTDVNPAVIAMYQDKAWITRPRPHVDRLACAWLIRKFINPDAVIHYAPHPEPDKVAFDMRDAQFGHQGNLCTFETMLRAFGLDEPALQAIAEIVHEIDLRDGRYVRPETVGIDLILRGCSRVSTTCSPDSHQR